MSSEKYVILFLGADWWGSDARALAVILRQLGHSVIEVNSEDFIPMHWRSLPLRLLRRAVRSLLVREYNRVVLRHLGNRAIDFLLVFKGMHLRAGTLERFCGSGLPAYCLYPDVSFSDYGSEISRCLPFYQCVFTTKSFHMNDAGLRQRVRDLRLVSHGFDPDVHRALDLPEHVQAAYHCDVSFVGCWSPKKEQILEVLLQKCPGLDLRIWGPTWHRAGKLVRSRWQTDWAYGDELCVIYRASKINLGLLSEAAGGTQVGDQVTVRSWQIPAAGGFMLHEATAELQRYFTPGRETAVFGSPAELVEKTLWFLENEPERRAIAAAGHARCLASGYTYLGAAQEILAFHGDHIRKGRLKVGS